MKIKFSSEFVRRAAACSTHARVIYKMLFKRYGITFVFLDRRVNFKMPFKGWAGAATLSTLWLFWDGIPDGKQESIYETTDSAGIVDYDRTGAAIYPPPKVKK